MTSGDIKIVGETFTDGWKPDIAQTEMEQFLTANNNKVDAVLSENDGMAGGVIAALDGPGPRRQGAGVRPGRRPGRPQPRRPRQRRPSSVWKDARELGKAAGEAAIRCARTRTSPRSPDTAPFTTPRGNTVTSILLKPLPITKDNLQTSSSTPGGSPRTTCARASRPGPSPPAADALRKLCALLRGSAAAAGRVPIPSRLDEAPR